MRKGSSYCVLGGMAGTSDLPLAPVRAPQRHPDPPLSERSAQASPWATQQGMLGRARGTAVWGWYYPRVCGRLSRHGGGAMSAHLSAQRPPPPPSGLQPLPRVCAPLSAGAWPQGLSR